MKQRLIQATKLKTRRRKSTKFDTSMLFNAVVETAFEILLRRQYFTAVSQNGTSG